jgi:redox-sensitive bicupin YhaK (pirin superfamily)
LARRVFVVVGAAHVNERINTLRAWPAGQNPSGAAPACRILLIRGLEITTVDLIYELMKKSVLNIVRSPGGHWVGDGFPVRTLFSYDGMGRSLSPFLMLDYAGPAEFPPAAAPRGVGEHPHRGFETVTIVYHGEVAHRDSAGNQGQIGPGDVQWMTAAAGVLHDEFHSPRFARAGGVLEMVQLWVNLPAAHKMSAPRYQGIVAAQIPSVSLPAAAGQLRVIAGEFAGHRGPAQTFTPMNVWDLRLERGHSAVLPIPAGHTSAVVVLRGAVRAGPEHRAAPAELMVFSPQGDAVELSADVDSVVLVLSGEPINEPIAGMGPFVMNTREELAVAVADFQAGRFGRMPRAARAAAVP